MINLENSIPKLIGKVRKEKWGGIYYYRAKICIDLLNEIAYDILSLCNHKNTVKDIVNQMKKDYEVDEQILATDINSFMFSAICNHYLTIDGIDREELINKYDLKPLEDIKEMKIEEQPGFEFLQEHKAIGVEPNVLSAPVKVLMELTYNCNLDCVHCFNDFCDKKPVKGGWLEGELNTEQWLKVIDDVVAAGVFDIFLSGGEPLIREDVFEIMRHIKSKNLGFCLLTNTTLITDEIAQKLKKVGCFKVEGNMDGYDAATYDQFRGRKGAFDETVKGIQACLRNGVGVRVNVTATKKNVFDLKKIIRTAQKIGVKELCVVPLEPGGRAQENWSDLNLTLDDHAELKEFYDEIGDWVKKEYGDDFIFVGPVDLLLKERDNEVANLVDPNQMLPLCGAGKYHCSINPTGNVILCPTAGETIKITPGNCLDYEFKDIWINADVFKAVRDVNNMPGCQTCDLRGTCGGGCQVAVFQKYGEVAAGRDPEMCRREFVKKVESKKENKS